MRFIFALMDSDGDGTVSLQEFQAAHEKIFKAIDTDKHGTLTKIAYLIATIRVIAQITSDTPPRTSSGVGAPPFGRPKNSWSIA